MDTAIVYKDRDNFFNVNLEKNSANLSALDMATITKFEIRFKNQYYDSETYPNTFIPDNDNANVEIKPNAFDLPLSRKGDIVEFIIYDNLNYNSGLVWSQFKLIVKKDAELIT